METHCDKSTVSLATLFLNPDFGTPVFCMLGEPLVKRKSHKEQTVKSLSSENISLPYVPLHSNFSEVFIQCNFQWTYRGNPIGATWG